VEENQGVLTGNVVREVENKLRTGLKSGRMSGGSDEEDERRPKRLKR